MSDLSGAQADTHESRIFWVDTLDRLVHAHCALHGATNAVAEDDHEAIAGVADFQAPSSSHGTTKCFKKEAAESISLIVAGTRASLG
jgi:hypothetical protein